jgi:hypothetical protein
VNKTKIKTEPTTKTVNETQNRRTRRERNNEVQGREQPERPNAQHRNSDT